MALPERMLRKAAVAQDTQKRIKGRSGGRKKKEGEKKLLIQNEQIALTDFDIEYKNFEEKFKPKKTTDDCYTPQNIFDAIQNWACGKYGIDPKTCVRPFYPGGDYVHFNYPKGCTVLDNPPFSIITHIQNFYMEHGIQFFLYAPSLTCCSNGRLDICRIIADAPITYENGAVVNTSFVTNLDKKFILKSAPDLHKIISAIDDQNRHKTRKRQEKYIYPDHVVTAAMVQYFSAHGTEYELEANDAFFIRQLDRQKESGKTIFGGGFLLSEKAAAEKAAAEKAAAEKAAATRWILSEYEKEIIKNIGKRRNSENELSSKP